eukprot:COSAG01_NODE_5586_length_4163_cov_1.538878_7_plen_211_part_00
MPRRVVFLTTVGGGAAAPTVLRRLGLVGDGVRGGVREHSELHDRDSHDGTNGDEGDFHIRPLDVDAESVGCCRGRWGRCFRMWELRLLATGSTEAAKAAAAVTTGAGAATPTARADATSRGTVPVSGLPRDLDRTKTPSTGEGRARAHGVATTAASSPITAPSPTLPSRDYQVATTPRDGTNTEAAAATAISATTEASPRGGDAAPEVRP